jgi:hypothetical protein
VGGPAGETYRIVASAITNDTGLVTGVVDFNVNFIEGQRTIISRLVVDQSSLYGRHRNWGASHEPGETFLVCSGLGSKPLVVMAGGTEGTIKYSRVELSSYLGVFTGDAVNQLTQVWRRRRQRIRASGAGQTTESVLIHGGRRRVYRL